MNFINYKLQAWINYWYHVCLIQQQQQSPYVFTYPAAQHADYIPSSNPVVPYPTLVDRPAEQQPPAPDPTTVSPQAQSAPTRNRRTRRRLYQGVNDPQGCALHNIGQWIVSKLKKQLKSLNEWNKILYERGMVAQCQAQHIAYKQLYFKDFEFEELWFSEQTPQEVLEYRRMASLRLLRRQFIRYVFNSKQIKREMRITYMKMRPKLIAMLHGESM